MTIATSLQQEKVEKATQAEITGVTASIDGGIVRRIIAIAYFLGLVLPTVGVFLIPDPRAFLVYSVYLFFAILCMIPTSLIYLASVDARLVLYRSHSGSLRVKFTDIETVPLPDVAVISKV